MNGMGSGPMSLLKDIIVFCRLLIGHKIVLGGRVECLLVMPRGFSDAKKALDWSIDKCELFDVFCKVESFVYREVIIL